MAQAALSIGEILAQEAKKLQLTVDQQRAGMFNSYAAELLKWNSKVNLTAITNAKEIAIKHFLDSIMLVPHLTAGETLLDMGSGAGLPVIPLKIMCPDVAMVSVDAVAKKIHFQRHIIRSLRLEKIEALHSRIEALHQSRCKSFSLITSRAFTRLDRFVEMAEPLLTDDGTLIAMKGGQAGSEIEENSMAVQASGFEVSSIIHYELPYSMGSRVLTVLKRCKA